MGTGSDTGVEGLEGVEHGAMNASLAEALPEKFTRHRVEGFFEVDKAAVKRASCEHFGGSKRGAKEAST